MSASCINTFGAGTVYEFKRFHAVDRCVEEFMRHGVVWPVSCLRGINMFTVPPDCFLEEREVKLGAEPRLVAIADDEFLIWPNCTLWFNCDYDLVLRCFIDTVFKVFV